MSLTNGQEQTKTLANKQFHSLVLVRSHAGSMLLTRNQMQTQARANKPKSGHYLVVVWFRADSMALANNQQLTNTSLAYC
jgi:hypothetical protein